MNKKILASIDLTEVEDKVISSALVLARDFKASLILLHVIPEVPLAVRSLLSPDEENTLKNNIEQHIKGIVAKKADLAKVSVEIIVRSGSVQNVIAQTIEKENPLMVVVGGHQTSHGISGLLQRDMAATIIRNSTAPVFIVRNHVNQLPKQILLPINPFEFLDESLLFASNWKALSNCKIDLFHVLTLSDWYGLYTDILHAYEADFVDKIEGKALDELNQIAEKHKSLQATTGVATGLIVEQINNRAQEIGAELILVPTHARKGVAKFFLGSVAEQIARYTDINVLTYHPENGFSA